MDWTDERVERLKALWADGLSASQIAGRLGGVSRNAVISKIHRLGLSGRAHTSRISRKATVAKPAQATRSNSPWHNRPRATNAPAPRPVFTAEPFEPVEEIDIPLAERKKLLDLTETCCRWPIGDPRHADFHFCGKTKVTGLPYCEFHARRAFQPPKPDRVRTESDIVVRKRELV